MIQLVYKDANPASLWALKPSYFIGVPIQLYSL